MAYVHNVVDWNPDKNNHTGWLYDTKVPVQGVNREEQKEYDRAYAENCYQAYVQVEWCENQNQKAENYRDKDRVESVLD